ncbi:MAG: hypothetical protein AB7I19_11205 [Planctomycetota bacterium]
MSNSQITVHCDFEVHAGKSEQAKSIRQRILDLTASVGNLTCGLDHCEASSRMSLTVHAQHEEAIRQMLLRIGPSLEHLAAHTSISRLACDGVISEALRKALAGFGAVFTTS